MTSPTSKSFIGSSSCALYGQSSNNLIDISKPQILLIGHSTPGFLLRDRYFRSHLFDILKNTCSSPSMPPLILPNIIQIQHENYNSSARLRSQHCDLRRVVSRCVSGLEGLWANNITNRERACNSSAGERSFRLTATVGRGPMVDDGKRSDDGVYEINANEEARSVSFGKKWHQSTANDTGNAAHRDPCPAVGRTTDAKADKKTEEDAYNARWHVEECGVWGAKSEGLDQSWWVGRYHSTRDRLLSIASWVYTPNETAKEY